MYLVMIGVWQNIIIVNIANLKLKSLECSLNNRGISGSKEDFMSNWKSFYEVELPVVD